MLSIGTYFFGATPDGGGFRSFPNGRSEALKHFDTSSPKNYRECIYETYDTFSIVNYIEHGVISGHRGTRSFGVSIVLESAVIHKERLISVSNFIEDYIDTNLVGEHRVFTKEHGKATYGITSFDAIETQMGIWIDDLSEKFLKKFGQYIAPKVQGEQPDEPIVLVSSTEEISMVGKQQSETTETRQHSQQDHIKGDLFSHQKASGVNEYFNTQEKSYGQYKHGRYTRLRKPVLSSVFISKKTMYVVLAGILVLHTLLLFKVSYVTGKTNDVLENLVAKQSKLSETNNPNTKFQKANPLASSQKSIPDYIVKKGDALEAIVSKINRRNNKTFTVKEIAEKNNIPFDDAKGWYKIIPKDIIVFE